MNVFSFIYVSYKNFPLESNLGFIWIKGRKTKSHNYLLYTKPKSIDPYYLNTSLK
jgi:hypothetical protein